MDESSFSSCKYAAWVKVIYFWKIQFDPQAEQLY